VNLAGITAKWANLEPAREALIDTESGERMTFGALDEQVTQLANAWLAAGVAKGDRIAILSKNSIDYFVIYFACARAGFIAQPLNWRLGVDELARIIADGSPKVFVSALEFAEQRAALKAQLNIEHWLESGKGASLAATIAGGSTETHASFATVGDHDPVLILYTGGTTGLSKGALHSHHTLYMGMINQTVAERVVPTDVYMLTGQMFHMTREVRLRSFRKSAYPPFWVSLPCSTG